MPVKGEYGSSEKGNFFVKDAIGVPHPYCITPRHVAVASDHHSGILDAEAIRDAERRGAKCDTCREIEKKVGKKILSFEEHEMALLVECKIDPKTEEGEKELRAWLLKIKDEATKNKYAGFAFMKSF